MVKAYDHDHDRLSLERFEQARRAPMPYTFEPMLPTPCDTPFSHANWLFERAFDGVRLLIFRAGAHVEIYTRSGEPRNAHFPGLVELFAAQPGERCVLDGEAVAAAGGTDTIFHAFDCPWIEGFDIRRVALCDRKRVLGAALDFSDRLLFTEYRSANGLACVANAHARGWAGVIAKQADSVYRSGRSKRWLKLSCRKGDRRS